MAELMLLGFISLLLTVSQNGITKICVPPGLARHMLPCGVDEKEKVTKEHLQAQYHFQRFFSFPGGTARRLLAEAAAAETHKQPLTKTEFCARKVSFLLHHSPLLSHSSTLVSIIIHTHTFLSHPILLLLLLLLYKTKYPLLTKGLFTLTYVQKII